jgi:hypothetical protein
MPPLPLIFEGTCGVGDEMVEIALSVGYAIAEIVSVLDFDLTH